MRLQDAGLNNAAPVRPGMDAGRANRALDGPLFALPRSQDYSERIKSCTARSWGRPAGKGISSPGRQQALMLKMLFLSAMVLIKNCGTALAYSAAFFALAQGSTFVPAAGLSCLSVVSSR